MGKIPFLSVDDRVEYLYARNYVPRDSVTPEERQFLERVNFHYLLGYGRHFRTLVARGRIDGDRGLARLMAIVQLDHEVSIYLFQGLKALEWRLRAHFVAHFSALYEPFGTYLSAETYAQASLNGDQGTHDAIREHVLRMREPYVVECFQKHAASSQLDTKNAWKPSDLPLSVQEEALASLPLWSVVDGWSFGLLERAIIGCKPSDDPSRFQEENERWVWKRVAKELGTANTMFPGQLESMRVLRNQVAHHARLWMRPSTHTPKAPKIYKAASRGVDPKAMYVVFLNLCSLLRLVGGYDDYLDGLDELLNRDPAYRLGITCKP